MVIHDVEVGQVKSLCLADVQQLVRRLSANILLANGVAHLKNLSMIYGDGVHTQLSQDFQIS